MSTKSTLVPALIDKVFTFEHRTPDDTFIPIHEFPLHKFIVERSASIKFGGKDIFKRRAFEVAIDATVSQLLREDDYGSSHVGHYSYQLEWSFRDLTSADVIELNRYFGYFGNIKYDESEQVFYSNRKRVQIDIKSMDKFLIGSLQLVLEVELERLKPFLLHGIPMEDWYVAFNAKDSKRQELVRRKLAEVLG